nr:retrovirus-related Pol polyprotein from transposon TNT 1-94 [Tanacetum cinerariifolium]
MALKNKENITGPKEIRPVWDNTARVNNQNKLTHPHPKRNFVPTAVLIKSRQVPVKAAEHSSQRAATLVSASSRVDTVASRPNVNNEIPTTYSYFKAHSPVRGPFSQKSAAKTNNFNEKVNTAKIIKKLMVDLLHLEEMLKDVKLLEKLLDESQVLLKVPRNNNMYSFDLKDVVPAKAVNTACYVQNRVLVVKPHNTTPHELFLGRKPALSFMRPFGCPVTILNTLDHLGTEPNWMFDIDTLTMSINYQLDLQGIKLMVMQGSRKEVADDAGKKRRERAQRNEFESMFGQDKDANGNKMFTPISATGSSYVNLGGSILVNVATLLNVDLPKPKKANQALTDLNWIEAMQDELLQFRLQKVKEYQEKDKIGSKSDKNGKRSEAEKSQKQLQ